MNAEQLYIHIFEEEPYTCAELVASDKEETRLVYGPIPDSGIFTVSEDTPTGDILTYTTDDPEKARIIFTLFEEEYR